MFFSGYMAKNGIAESYGALGFPTGSAVKNSPAMWETRVPSLGWEYPLERGMATHSSGFLPGEAHGQRSLVGSSPWGRKESDTTEVTKHARVVALFLVFGGTSILFSVVAVQVYIGRWILNAWTTRGDPRMQTWSKGVCGFRFWTPLATSFQKG